MPVGFVSGVPIGMELMARTLEDADLVAMAYAFEQATDHRRIPPNTPALSDGAAPSAVVLALRPGQIEKASGLSLSGNTSLNPVSNKLMFDIRLRGVEEAEVLGVVLRVPHEDGGWQVADLVMRAGQASARHVVSMTSKHREALDEGEMHLLVLTRADPRGAIKVHLDPSR